LQEKNKHHHKDQKPKDKKNNKNKPDDDGDKGDRGKQYLKNCSDSKKPRTEWTGPKPVNTEKGEALKTFLEYFLEARDKCN
jgi:hypothetical protein